MHRRWMSLPLLTNAVAAFYPYRDGSQGDHERKFVPSQSLSGQTRDDLVTVDIKKAYHKRDNTFLVVQSSPTSTENSIPINQDGSDYSYFSTFKFGSKAQELYMLIDTGSANTWVMGHNCASKSCTVHNLLSQDSSTLNVTTNKWSMSYGTGTVSGVVATDDVKFANFTMKMGFGLATVASDDFNAYPMDGILGLGRTSSNELGVPTVMENLKTQGKLAKNILGINLNRGSDETKDGEIVFGGVNKAKYDGEISYTKTSNPGAWEIPVDDVSVNDAACGLTGKSAIIDTGTSYILMPPADAKKLHSLIPGSVSSGETYTLPCDSKANVQVGFSGVKYSISPNDYIGRETAKNVCNSNIVGHQAYGPNEWILGDVFLKNVYAVFDFDQARIGFAKLQSRSPSPSSTAGSSTTLATSTGPATGTGASAPSSSSSAVIGNPFDVSSSPKNAATSIHYSTRLALVMAVAFFIGLFV